VKDDNAWIYFDGPEPESLRPLLDVLRNLPPSTPAEKEQRVRRVLERLDAEAARRGEVANAGAIPRAPAEHPVGDVGRDGATVRSPSFDERPSVPLPAEPPPVDAREPRPAEGWPVEDWKTITSVVEVPAELRELMGRLPFMPRAPGPELARTMKAAAPYWLKGQTAPLGEDSIPKPPGAALPFVKNTVGPALAPFPLLPLEAYASLRAELSLWPERSAEILPRYHVNNEAAHAALEEHWQRELAASPEARARFGKLLAEFTAWLRTPRV